MRCCSQAAAGDGVKMKEHPNNQYTLNPDISVQETMAHRLSQRRRRKKRAELYLRDYPDPVAIAGIVVCVVVVGNSEVAPQVRRNRKISELHLRRIRDTENASLEREALEWHLQMKKTCQ